MPTTHTDTDAYTRFLEAFARAEHGVAAFFYPEQADEPEPAEAEPADEDWTTEAINDYYNS